MTTYSLSGAAIYTGYVSGDFVAIEDPGVTLDLVMPDTQTTFRYSLNPPEPGDPLGTAVIDTGDYNIRFNGQTLVDGPVGGFAPDFSVLANVAWNGGVTTTMGFVFFEWAHPTFGRVDAEYIFDVGGAALPPLISEAAYDAFAASITGAFAAGGGLAPGIDIPFTALRGVTVTEHDRIQGTRGDDIYDGGLGRDRISGGFGDDQLFGGSGRDILIGGGGADRLDGGGGIDTASYAGAFGGVTVDIARDGRNSGADARGDVLHSIENLIGSRHDDALAGSARDNRIKAARGDDRLEGRAGNDTLLGGSGKDWLAGQVGHDTLAGGGGRDRLAGGTGDDTMTGGAGRDTFVFNAGHDRITDFNGDILRIDDALWGGRALSPGAVIDFARVTGADTVFTFGAGDTLTLDGYSDLIGLAALIEVF